MKKIAVVFVILLVLGFAEELMATGTCVHTITETVSVLGERQRKMVTLTCTSDASGIAAYSFTPSTFGVKGWYLYNVTTDPDGTSAPTADYDITLLATGEDVSGSLLLNRSATARQTVAIAPTTLGYHMADGAIAITFANITSNPGILVMTLRFTAN